MGVMKFRLPPNDANRQVPDYRKAYITGLDRTPGRLAVELRNGVMTCTRESTESGRLFVPWPIEGFGMPLVGTATLAERPAPYTLAVELARGKLNDIRNQLSDWLQLGLRSTPQLEKTLAEAQKAFVVAATTTDRAHRVRSGSPNLARCRHCGRRFADRRLHLPDSSEPALIDFPLANAPRVRFRRTPSARDGCARLVGHLQHGSR